MATNEITTRLALCADSITNWNNSTKVLLKGEIAIAFPETGSPKFKIGDGFKPYKELPETIMTPEEIKFYISQKGHSHDNKGILDAITSSLIGAWNSASEHAQSPHAPANIEAIVNSHMNNKSNPHGVTKTQIGLGNVNNTADVDKPLSDAALTALNGKISTELFYAHSNNANNPHNVTAEQVMAIPTREKGKANGVAELGGDGKVPSSQLPSYVDDAIEGRAVKTEINNGIYVVRAFNDVEGNPIVPESGKVYIDVDENKTYRWTGSVYAVIGSDLALGETSATAYRGDRGKIAYDHSQTAHAPSNAERNTIVGITKNGATVTPNSSRIANITVPTKVSELTNDSKYLTEVTTDIIKQGVNVLVLNGGTSV